MCIMDILMEIVRQRDRETGDRETERQRDREIERQRDRETERGRGGQERTPTTVLCCYLHRTPRATCEYV